MMATIRWVMAGVALLATGGCLGGGPKPFTQSIAAQALRPIHAPAPAQTLAPEPDVAPLPEIPAKETPAADPEIPAAPEVEREDVRGRGDGSMKVDRVVIPARLVPHRIADYSAEQTASMICVAEKAGFNAANARRAHEATLRAAEMQMLVETGGATRKQADDAELKRQSAVRSYIIPIPLLDMLISPAQSKDDLPKPRFDTLVIEDADLFLFMEHGKDVMAVSGVVRNTGTHTVEPPPLTLAALDAWELQLAAQTSLLPFDTLAPGEARAFELRFNNPPSTTAEVYIHFAPPFGLRSRRDCDSFDPAADTSSETGADPSTAPIHTLAELNLLTLYFRRESAAAWRCRDWTAKTCGWARHALHWRDMFVMSEAIDAAWVASQAAGASPGDDDAKAARDKALASVAQLGDAALARAGTSAPGVAVTLTASTHGRDADGLFVDIAGRLANTAAEPEQVDALMLAFVDRLDLPLSSLAIEFPRRLNPGETVSFSERIRVTEAADPDRFASGRRNQTEDALARAPPPSIPWQVRVGAMAR